MRTTDLGVPARIYVRSVADADHCLAQGEFISGLICSHINLISLEKPPLQINQVLHPLAVTVSQGCDLEQDFLARKGAVKPDKVAPSVLFCEVVTASELRSLVPKDSKIWARISQNNDERYHFFQAVTPEFDATDIGLEEQGVDFKRFFTIPTDELYYRIRIGEAKRRCRLDSPYLEHFCRRYANYISRVALPEQHESV
jgi:hypothetical protein